MWAWFDSLVPGTRPQPKIAVWPRGGAKSTTAEGGTTLVAAKGTRRFGLYVSGTQDQADQHVGNIAELFEHQGVERSVGKYGNSRGWRRNQLRTATGFSIQAIGLDTAARGIKMGQYRPDLIILDDIDGLLDTPETVAKKIAAITKSILPSGSSDCAILGVQNLVHEDSVFSMLADGRADFLLDREPVIVEPAVIGLVTEQYADTNGVNRHRIIGGEPTWQGQSLETCQRQIDDWGLRAFLEEAQQEVASVGGWFFDVAQFRSFTELPGDLTGWRFVLAWDLAATHGGGDYTVGVLMARSPMGLYFVVDVIRGQWSSEEVRQTVRRASFAAKAQYGNVRTRLTQDPGQAGKDQMAQFVKLLDGLDLVIRPATGNKAVRARGYADAVNDGNVSLMDGPWVNDYKLEHRKFTEDGSHVRDDQIDAGADAYNELASKKDVALTFF